MAQMIQGRVKSVEFLMGDEWVDLTQQIKYFEVSTLDEFEKWLFLGKSFQAVFISEDGTARIRVSFFKESEDKKS